MPCIEVPRLRHRWNGRQSGSLGSSTRELNDGMASLTDAGNALATSAEAGADLASLTAGVDALATDVGGLDAADPLVLLTA
jgi:hypothetical protein